MKRFPKDFMFQVNDREKQELIDHYEYLQGLKYSTHHPFVFTEHGAVMLASVLNSKRAIEANIRIVRIFTKMREILEANRDVIARLDQLEQQVLQSTADIGELFIAIRQLISPELPARKKIGFKRSAEKD